MSDRIHVTVRTDRPVNGANILSRNHRGRRAIVGTIRWPPFALKVGEEREVTIVVRREHRP